MSYRPEGSTTTKFYYYVQNLQGDVIALVDSANGNTVVTYTYDAWGNVLSTNGSLATTLGVLNPFRYRGYVYDSETKLYYLQSRYYNPAMGRFINADAYASTGQGIIGNNMFAYCDNNPVNKIDPSGTCGYVAGTTFWMPCGNSNCPYYSPYAIAFGVSGSITLGPFVYGLQLALVSDSMGSSELQLTYYSAMSTDALANTQTTDDMLAQVAKYEKFTDIFEYSLAGNMSYFNTPSVENLHGEGYQIGGMLGTEPAVAVDFNIVPNGSESPYTGWSLSIGKGSTDGHCSMGYTIPLCSSKMSVFDIMFAAYNTQYGG